MIGAALAALAAVASLAQKSAKDAEDARRENSLKALHKQQNITGILQSRAQAGGANTLGSQLASGDQQFLRQLAAGRRDTSGDAVPFVNAVSGIAQGVASDIDKSTPQSVPASSVNFQSYSGPDVQTSPVADNSQPMLAANSMGDEEDRDRFLANLANRSGGYLS